MIHVIANPAAGGGRAVPAASTLARAIAGLGAPCHVHVPADEDETRRIAQRVAPEGIVVACGGDGTVHTCVQGLLAAGITPGSRPRMAIWPVGTGNDIVRGLGPVDVDNPEAFAEYLVAGNARPVDVGHVTIEDSAEMREHFFLGVLSCGFDSDVNERANAMPAKVGRARYLLGVARELPSFRPRWFAIDSDATDRSMAAMVVAIGNGPAYGSGMFICPGARTDDGLFDVTVVTNVAKRTLISVLPRVYTGRHMEHEAVEAWRAQVLRIDAPDSVVYADGERLGSLPARIQVKAGALLYIGPPAHPELVE